MNWKLKQFLNVFISTLVFLFFRLEQYSGEKIRSNNGFNLSKQNKPDLNIFWLYFQSGKIQIHFKFGATQDARHAL